MESWLRGSAGDWSMCYCGDVAGVVVCSCYRSRHTPAMAKVLFFTLLALLYTEATDLEIQRRIHACDMTRRTHTPAMAEEHILKKTGYRLFPRNLPGH